MLWAEMPLIEMLRISPNEILNTRQVLDILDNEIDRLSEIQRIEPKKLNILRKRNLVKFLILQDRCCVSESPGE